MTMALPIPVASGATHRFGIADRLFAGLACCFWIISAPAIAGQARDPGLAADDAPPVAVDARVVRTADTIGQRQTRTDVAREAGIEPMGRVGNRIANRVQSRLRSRIDRNYDPQANAVTPFATAQEQARGIRRPR